MKTFRSNASLRSTSAAFAAVFVGTTACSPSPETRSAVERGRVLFDDPAASDARQNLFSCATCHRQSLAPTDNDIVPGAALAGVTARPKFWGGQESDLLQAINTCRLYFMGASRPWTPDDEPAKAMYAWLVSLPPEAAGPQPFTIVPIAKDLPAGDRQAGSQVYDRGCRACHGVAHTGDGLLSGIPTLPEQAVANARSMGFSPADIRVGVIEKVRHGGFLGLTGRMPPYSAEVISDVELGSLLAFLDLYP